MIVRSTSLVSIITPFKNTAAFLSATLDSILTQTYENWELIAVNDHSTDESKAIVERYAKMDARIHVYDNPGNGIIDALQFGAQNCRGTFITRMDSDDLMVPHKLATMVNDLLTHGTGHVALGLVNYFSDEFEIGPGYQSYQNWLNNLTSQGTNYSEIYKECVIASPCWMTYKTDFDLTGGFNFPDYPEDYDLTFRFYKYGLCCIPSTQVLHYWRDYATRTSRTHVNYANNTFLALKTRYFLELHHEPTQTLYVWGAGKKGKTVAKILIENNIDFKWICDNPKKIGKSIYNQQMLDFNTENIFENAQSIITVANPEAQKTIKKAFEQNNKKPLQHFFFFC